MVRVLTLHFMKACVCVEHNQFNRAIIAQDSEAIQENNRDYVAQEGYEVKGKESKVCRLNEPLYGFTNANWAGSVDLQIKMGSCFMED